MSLKESTTPGVFIIESLNLEDEESGHFEGEVISSILNFSRILHKYHYIRTEAELVHFVEIFRQSNYRYLHISCHGNKESIGTTLNTIPFKQFAFILEGVLDKRRLFLSACSSTNDLLAKEIFGVTECNSLIGMVDDVNMNDAAIFWASFYHLMFKQNSSAMKRDDLEGTLKQLSHLHNIPMKYYSKSKLTSKGFTIVDV